MVWWLSVELSSGKITLLLVKSGKALNSNHEIAAEAKLLQKGKEMGQGEEIHFIPLLKIQI
jgi:hypothetical protein